MIAVTGATGQLGRLVMDQLMKTLPASDIVAVVRNPEKAGDFAAKGVLVRQADYDQPGALVGAFAGVEKLMLISSSEVGQRARQHGNVIDAARQTGVGFMAYTSLLHADTSSISLAGEHHETEARLTDSGIPHAVLRNGWYTENYTAGIGAVLAHGAVLGCAGDGRISSAARADYAAAAATVILTGDHAGKIYELAGDSAYTLREYAAEIARQSGKDIHYQNLSEDAYAAVLEEAGLPGPLAAMLADSETGIAAGALFDDGKALSRLINRPTTPLAKTVARALAG